MGRGGRRFHITLRPPRNETTIPLTSDLLKLPRAAYAAGPPAPTWLCLRPPAPPRACQQALLPVFLPPPTPKMSSHPPVKAVRTSVYLSSIPAWHLAENPSKSPPLAWARAAGRKPPNPASGPRAHASGADVGPGSGLGSAGE